MRGDDDDRVEIWEGASGVQRGVRRVWLQGFVVVVGMSLILYSSAGACVGLFESRNPENQTDNQVI